MENKKSVRKVLARVGVGVASFVLALSGAYFLTPNKTRVINLDVFGSNEQEDSHFQQFIDKTKRDFGLDDDQGEEKVKNFLNITFDQFQVQYKVENSDNLNTIKVNGDLDFAMFGLFKNITFNLDADIDYNNRHLPLELGYSNETLYFGLKDLRLKASQTTIDHLGEVLQEFVFATELSNPNGLNIDTAVLAELYEKVDGILSLENVTELISKFSDENKSTSIVPDIHEEKEGSGWNFTVGLTIETTVKATEEGEEDEVTSNTITLNIHTDGDYNLKSLDLNTIQFGDVTITGGLKFKTVPLTDFVSPEDRHPEMNYNYIEMFNYSGWIKKLAEFLSEDNQKLGLGFEMNLDYKGENPTDVVKVEGSINVDFSELIDLSNYKAGTYVPPSNEDEEEEEPQEPEQNVNQEEKTLLDDIKDKMGFNLQLDIIGQENIKYAGFGAGYFKFNETTDELNNKKSVMKFKVDTETVNWMVNELPGIINSLSGSDSNKSLTTMFSFLTESEVVEAIKDGDYAVILDMLDTLNNDESKINIGLALSGLGIGDDARVDIILNSTYGDENAKVLTLNASDIAFGDYSLGLNVETGVYKATDMGDPDSYDSLDFLPSVVDQVAGLVDRKAAGFDIDATITDANKKYLDIEGYAQFDNSDGVKEGFGQLIIDQYKSNQSTPWYSHKLAVDVDNSGEELSDNNAYFIYGPLNSDNIKGKTDLQSVVDIWTKVIKPFIDDAKDDPRYNKFLEPITKLLGVSALASAIQDKNYARLAANDLLSKIGTFSDANGDGLEIIVCKDLLGLDSDINVKVYFTDEKKIDRLNVTLKFGEKDIDLTLGLKEYDDDLANPFNKNDSYMDLSGIKELLRLGINTTKLGYYHLTADILMDIPLGSFLDIDLYGVNAYIYVDGSNVKLYGVLPDVPSIALVSMDATAVENITTEFTFETYKPTDPDYDPDDEVGGYFHIKRSVTKSLFGWGWSKTYSYYYYKATSKAFLDNILGYILSSMIGLTESTCDMVGNLSLSSEEKPAGNFVNTFTDTGFSFSETGNPETSSHKETIKVGLNMNELTGVSQLGALELTLNSAYDANYGDCLSSLHAEFGILIISVTADLRVANLGTNATWATDKYDNVALDTRIANVKAVNVPTNKMNDPFKYVKK